jgi:hypothetical protein
MRFGQTGTDHPRAIMGYPLIWMHQIAFLQPAILMERLISILQRMSTSLHRQAMATRTFLNQLIPEITCGYKAWAVH